MCDKLSHRARRFLLEKTNKSKQNNYAIHQIMTEHCYTVCSRPPNNPALRSDIKKRVATKKHDFKAFQVCYRAWSGFLTFRKLRARSQRRELLAQGHIAQDMNATAVRTWNLTRISKSRISNVSFLHSALVVSLTIRPLYPG